MKYPLACSKDGNFLSFTSQPNPLTTAVLRLAGAGAVSPAEPVLLSGWVSALLHKDFTSLKKYMGNKTHMR